MTTKNAFKMKKKSNFIQKNKKIFYLFFILLAATLPKGFAQEKEGVDFAQFKGSVVDAKNKNPLEFATISVNNTNISTITNVDGEFVLKVPTVDLEKNVTISYLGYANTILPLSSFMAEETVIKLVESSEKLPEVNVVSADPNAIIEKLIANKNNNYFQDPIIMKAFYRESIKKRKTYASLSEAVVDIYKRPYSSAGIETIKLNKARKSTDYRKVDTLVIKLQGGPYNTLHMDLMKNEEIFFNEEIFSTYKFTFDKAINIDNRLAYVIDFKGYPNFEEPLFYGKLYIDASSFALSKAIFSLDLKDKSKATKYFVKKKPAKADVIPEVANFRVDYRVKDGKWYYGYSRIELSFKIDWTKKLFNSIYNVTSEMAITDWEINADKDFLKGKERMRTNVILNEEASGFSDPEFWGEYNVIEPEKSIENAIKKIQRRTE
jgi:hypothetical protein